MPVHSMLDPIDAATKAVDALLTAIDGAPAVGAVTTYKAAIARHRRNLVDTAGPEALATVIKCVRNEAPGKVEGEQRERVRLRAWAGLAAKD